MKAIRAGLYFLFAFAVLAFGAVEVWSESVLEIGAAALLLAWAIIAYRNADEKWEWNPLNWPLLALLGIGLLQLLLRTTAYAFFTREELLKLAAYWIIFFLSTQAFRGRKVLTELTSFLVFLCFAVSLFGIAQHFTSTDKIYWLRTLTQGGDLFGPFVNRNHFAGFVELTLPAGLALMAFGGLRRELFPLATLLTMLPVSALVLSGSRGGIVSFVFELGVLTLLVRSRRSKEGPRMAVLAIVGLAALALIVWIGADKAIERFSSLPKTDTSLARRASMARAASHIFFEHPLLGSGLGALVVVYPRYETVYDGRVVEHVHDDYMEALAETGLGGAVCGFFFLGLLYRGARANFEAEQGHFSRAVHAGAIVALAGLLLHSFVDFNLHVPSNALLFLLQAHLATSAPPFPSENPMQRVRRRSRHERAEVPA
ncbi:MAG TPA: O-antigen ligase family protein [Candidatus Limnocylindrales bacterium]|nr:O-antigen ligase family protein [Candidatus Limnocylindrales bacterium]